MLTRIKMIAITISNSIREKPRERRLARLPSCIRVYIHYDMTRLRRKVCTRRSARYHKVMAQTVLPPPPTVDAAPDHKVKTLSGIPIKPVYGPADAPKPSSPAPGEFPYTRGIHPTMYRRRLWTR